MLDVARGKPCCCGLAEVVVCKGGAVLNGSYYSSDRAHDIGLAPLSFSKAAVLFHEDSTKFRECNCWLP